jgi:hypothetical protein
VRFPEDLKVGKYGPYGSPGSGKYPFSFPGMILGLFGQSNDYLDAIGFDIDTTLYSPDDPYYKKTSVVGVDIGEPFDDALASLSPVKITTLTIRYSEWIDGIETTYILRNGTTVVKGHGAFNPTKATHLSVSVRNKQKFNDKNDTKVVISQDDAIIFADNEWILRIDADIEGEKDQLIL